jgi:multiple sugar transport system ATP-binding protein
LGALDAEFRESMRAEIKKLHIDQHATTVYVTHDQIEAMAMGDRIVVMSDAEIQQVGTPDEIYYDPSNLFVARFVGSPGMNLAQGQLADGVVQLAGGNRLPLPAATQSTLSDTLGPDGEVIVGFRPESAEINENGSISGDVYASEHHGAYTMLHVNLNEHDIVHIRSDRLVRYPIGTPVRFDLVPQMARFFNATTEQAIQVEAAS